MNVSDDMLMALADGEFDAVTAADLRAVVAKDARLSAELRLLEESNRLLREASDAGPIPARLIAAIEQAPPPAGTAPAWARRYRGVLAAPERRASERDGRRGGARPSGLLRNRLAGGAAMAASLALAFFAGGHWLQPLAAPGAAPQLGFEVAALAERSSSLMTGQSLQLEDGSTLRVLASYDSDQGLCRTLARDSDSRALRDVVCQTDAGWQTAFSLTAAQQAGFLPASDALSASLDAFLDTIAAGSPFSPEEERQKLGLAAAP